MTRSLLVVVLLVVVVGAVAGIVSGERDDVPPEAAAGPSPLTPVLSARRIPALLAAPIADRRLAAALDELVARQPGTTCVSIGASGRTVYAHEAGVPLVPASIAKLLTAAVALEVLGPEHRFRTTVVAAAPPVDGVVDGDVWLVGSGDPVLATADYAASFRDQPPVVTPLESLADQLVAAGVTSVTGDLLGDGSRYDDDRYPDSWPERYISQDQSGPLSALTVNDGWETFPPTYDLSVPDERPAADPNAHAAAQLAEVLAQRGGEVGSTGAGVAPAGATELAAVESAPLTEVVGQLLRQSDNQTGELLLKEIALASGRPPTTADGAAVVLEVGARLGLPMGGVVVADGSGLATTNQMSCDLARAIVESPTWGPVLTEALPVAAQEGTLVVRFVDTPVAGRLRGKTGTLDDVTALAGVLDTIGGEHLTFSWIVNDSGSATPSDGDIARQDELAAVLDRYPEGPSLDELGPQPVPAPAPEN